MNQRRGNVRGGEAFFHQSPDEVILFREFAALQKGAQFANKYVGARIRDFIGGGNFGAMDARLGEALDLLNLKQFASGDERNSAAAAARAPGAPDAMHVIFRIV